MGNFTERFRRIMRNNPKVYEVRCELFVDKTSAGIIQLNVFGRTRSEAKANAVRQLQEAVNVKVLQVNKHTPNKNIE